MSQDRCACCRTTLKDTEVESQLYSPILSYTLCEYCGAKEESEIDRLGTNNIPELLAQYQRGNH